MEKVAVYVSFKNNSRNSIDFLLNRIANWCLLKNYDYTIYFDKVKDRKNFDERKEFNILKEDIENKEYSKLIIKDISQLSINTGKNVEFLNFLEKYNCEIESMDGMDLSLYKLIYERFNKKKEERTK